MNWNRMQITVYIGLLASYMYAARAQNNTASLRGFVIFGHAVCRFWGHIIVNNDDDDDQHIVYKHGLMNYYISYAPHLSPSLFTKFAQNRYGVHSAAVLAPRCYNIRSTSLGYRSIMYIEVVPYTQSRPTRPTGLLTIHSFNIWPLKVTFSSIFF